MWLRLAVQIALALACWPGLAAAQSDDEGRAAFEARCVGCHGADGTGGARGPAIVDLRQPKAAGVPAIDAIIRTGLPDAGMPAFVLADAERAALARYVHSLRVPAADQPVDGDAARGEAFFAGAGGCSRCHMVAGRGGILGPDLTNLARERRRSQIERALAESGASTGVSGRGASAPSRTATIALRDGRRLRGLVKYDTLFDLGLIDLKSGFHSLSRQDMTSITWEPSLMPSLQASAADRRDLLAYLTRLTSATARPPVPLAASADADSAFDALRRPATGEWPTYHGHLSGNRHSPLTQITTDNVSRLAPRWTFQVPGQAQRTLQTTPVVVGGLMYVTAVNEVWALDARTGREVWRFTRPRTPGLVGDPAAGLNRGVAILGERLFLQTDHAHLIALHRMTGHLLWDVEMADYRQHYGATGAPLAVRDLVIAGVSGGDEGMRGFLDAYRATTGERVWRFWTVPGPGEPNHDTWIGRAWEHGCAATWLTGTYDPAAGLLYWPTGNPCPDYSGDERQGDNLYANSVIALEAATGRLRWHFQFTPHDLHDWDAAATPLLADAVYRGRPRTLLLHGDRNGYFYVLDRLTGEFLLGAPFVKNITWARGLDPEGRPLLVDGQAPTPEGTRTCPAVTGATNWPSTAFNPATGFFYLMAEEACSIYTKNATWWTPGQSFYGGTTRRSPDDVPAKFLRAIDIQTGRIAWEIPALSGGVIASGVMSTAGGLVFFGEAAGGALVAADARTGALLWHFDTGLGWKAGPMSYAINGRQYIGVVAGSTVFAFGLPETRP